MRKNKLKHTKRTYVIYVLLLCFNFSLNAKDYVFKTQMYGDWVLNDVTKVISFRSNKYELVRIEETNSGYTVSCTLGNDKRLFEIYNTQTATYLVEYEDQTDINFRTQIENLKKESNKATVKAIISHESYGNLDIDEMIRLLTQNPNHYYNLTGASSDYQNSIIKRTLEILNTGKKYKISISKEGFFTLTNPGGVNNKFLSTGVFNKKRGNIIFDENTINNLSYFIILRVAEDTYNNYSNTKYDDFFKEGEKRLMLARIEKSYEEQIEAWKRGNATNLKWIQILKTEINNINQTQQNSNTQSTQSQPQKKTKSSSQNTLKKDPNFKIE